MRSRRSRMLWPVVSVGFAAALGTAILGSTAVAKGPGPGPATENEEASAPRVLTKADRRVTRRIITQRNATWRWQDVMQVERTPYTGGHEQSTSRPYRRWVLRVWESRAKRAWRKATRPPHYDEWMCIHRYEGSWVDPNAPYYGGLQMDVAFPARLRRQAARDEGHGRQLVAARADVGRRAGARVRPGLLPVAEHGQVLQPLLAAQLRTDDLDDPAPVALAVELEEQHALPLAEQ